MRTIAVCSFKGGTAKTSVSLHIGSALAKFHKARVLLIDFDAQANLTAGLGFDPDHHESLASVLQGERALKDVIQKTQMENLDLIPADTWLERVEVTGSLASDRYSHERLKKLIETLDYDYVLIDTPPSLCWLTESSLIAAQSTLVCATAEFYSVKGLERLSQFIAGVNDRHPTDVLGVVLSFWNPRGKNNSAFLDVIENSFGGKLLKSKIRRDVAVSEAAIYGKPLFEVSPSSRAAGDYRNLTEEIIKLM
jgi:chromosome partitioning protein